MKLPHGVITVGIILAVGICTALNILVIAVIVDAILNPAHAGISENSVQILLAWGGGVTSVISAIVGYQVGVNSEVRNRKGPPDEAVKVGD